MFGKKNVSNGENSVVRVRESVVLVLTNEVTGKKRIIKGKGNIVTTAGNVYYAQAAAASASGGAFSPTNVFACCYLATAGPGTPGVTDNYGSFTVQAASEKALTANYPKAPDVDADNTGLGTTIVTWAYAYATTDGNWTTPITHSFIAKASAGGTDPILNSYKWAQSWTKDSSTSAKVFFNHTLLGA